MYDVIVVGGGAAGMTAALYALRNGKSVLILEKEGFGGQITHSPKVENFPGFLSASGNEIADKLFEQIVAQGVEFEIDTVTSVIDGETKTVKTEYGNAYEGKTVDVELIDTWNMTVTHAGRYSGSFQVKFPARPYMAARITAVV